MLPIYTYLAKNRNPKFRALDFFMAGHIIAFMGEKVSSCQIGKSML